MTDQYPAHPPLTPGQSAAEAAAKAATDQSTPFKPWGMDPRPFCTLMHLSPLLPSVGWILFLVMWVTNKDQSDFVKQCGRSQINWLISLIIYAVVCVPLCFICIGFLLLAALVLCSLVFTIIAAIKANEGVVWKFPLTIPFMPVDTSVSA